jgi:hypothetical protein
MSTYQPRHVSQRSPINVNAFRLKRYELRCAHPMEESGISEQQWITLLSQCLPLTNQDPGEHLVGFAILHYGADGTYLLASRWYGGNMLKHEAFTVTRRDDTVQVASLHDTRIVACVWELEVIAFERNAWVRTTMSKEGPGEDGFADYLQASFEGWV